MTARRWAGPVPTHCDVCRQPITGAYVDGRTTLGGGIWATMCLGCHAKHGCGLGDGTGHRYEDNGCGWQRVDNCRHEGSCGCQLGPTPYKAAGVDT